MSNRRGKAQETRSDEPVAQAAVEETVATKTTDTDEQSPRKKWTPPTNPFPFEMRRGQGNRVHLIKSETEEDRTRGTGAWVIRFEQNPNEMEGHSKTNPHPVIAYLKSEGFRWAFDEADGKGGWGKPFQGDPAGTDAIEARRVYRKAADMIGAEVEAGRTPF